MTEVMSVVMGGLNAGVATSSAPLLNRFKLTDDPCPPPVDVIAAAALGAGGSAAGGSAAIEVVGAVVVFVSTPGAVRTSIPVGGAELNLVGGTWD